MLATEVGHPGEADNLADKRRRRLWGETFCLIHGRRGRLTDWIGERGRLPRRWWRTRKWLLTGETDNPQDQGGDDNDTPQRCLLHVRHVR